MSHKQYLDIKINDLDENIEDLEFIKQTLKLVNAISLSSMPMMPDLGSVVPDYVDQPLTVDTKSKLVSGTYLALNDIFPDVEVKGVTVNYDNGTLQVIPNVKYTGDLRS